MAGVAAALTAVAAERRIDGNEWQDMTRMSLGREETRAAFAPFPDEKSALAILPWTSPRQITLDSDTAWKFKWSKDPVSRPVGFEKPAYDVSSWETIKVPCSWQAFGANGKGGWGVALYTNVVYPFKCNPPFVMDEPPRHFTNYEARNPVGAYRRDFDLPKDWTKDRVFLKFDGVDSFYYLWVNGRYVGFTKDSRCAAEYDVTDLVKPGKNTVALEVYRYSDGSYLEDQDMFRLSGIFRSTWLVRRPATRIRDFFARARPATARDFAGDWVLDVETDLAAANGAAATGEVSVSLYTLAGEKVAIKPLDASRTSFLVTKPRLWSPETPNCYKVVVALAQGGKVKECVSTLFGFRVSEIHEGRYELNGQRVKLHGADRHETDPQFGHFCPRARQEEDVRLLKRANCNIVRNSHYPQDDYWYYLCDLNGICLMDEANVECHGYTAGGNDPKFKLPMVWRNMNMVERNKNHPSVLFWSHGNESGSGANFKAADDAVHARDRSRPTHYEGDWSNSDIDSNMYPSVDTVKWRASDKNAKRPYFLCEYAHNMINAMGNLKDYQDAIESSDVTLGACIWDWVDQGLYKIDDKGRKIIAYGGDFGDQPNDGQFVMNGCILSDRRVEPAYYEIKHVFQPVSVTLNDDNKSVTVFNKQFFRSLAVYDVRWGVLVNGKVVETGNLNLDAVGPRGTTVLPLPATALASVGAGRSVSVRYGFACRAADGYLPKGYVSASDQIDLPNKNRAVRFTPPAGKVRQMRTDGHLEFTAGDVKLAFDTKTGALASYQIKGVECFTTGLRLDAYRAPSSNELGPASRWSACGWRAFDATVERMSAVKNNGDSLSFDLETLHRGRAKEELHDYGRAGGRLEKKGAISDTVTPVFRVVQHWRVYGDGTVTCQSEIRPQGLVGRELPRIGYRFTLPLDFGTVNWFGRGPFENYRDRKSGAFRGLWKTTLADFVMPYARSEDANNFEETDAITLSGAKGAIGFATLGAPVAFAAIPYDPAEIIAASHPEELPKPSKVEFGLFAETRGLGGASCGPGPLKHDIITTARDYRLDFAIRPQAVHTALSVPDVELPKSESKRHAAFGKYRLLSASSQERGHERADNAFDGEVDTYWHSKWQGQPDDYPHTVACDLGGVKTVKGLLVLPRQDMANGRVRDYRIEVSTDGQSWTKVNEGRLPNSEDVTELIFQQPAAARYLRFTALAPHRHGEKWATMAELQPLFATQP